MSERERDVFDDLDALTVQAPKTVRAPIDTVVVPKPRRAGPGWEKVSRAKAKQIGGITCVYVHLICAMSFSHGRPVPATTKTTGCDSRKTRNKALRRLEELGLAIVKWRGNGVAPMVRLT